MTVFFLCFPKGEHIVVASSARLSVRPSVTLLFFCSPKGEHIVTALSVQPSVCLSGLMKWVLCDLSICLCDYSHTTLNLADLFHLSEFYVTHFSFYLTGHIKNINISCKYVSLKVLIVI